MLLTIGVWMLCAGLSRRHHSHVGGLLLIHRDGGGTKGDAEEQWPELEKPVEIRPLDLDGECFELHQHTDTMMITTMIIGCAGHCMMPNVKRVERMVRGHRGQII